jgi:recombination protein RecT
MSAPAANTKAITTPLKIKVDSLRQLLAANGPELKKVLPKMIDLERFQRVVINSALRTPALLDCTAESMILAIQEAAQRGLEPDGVMGYLIPYGKVAQFLPHWRGLMHVARKSGDIAKFAVRAVHVGDVFEWEYGLNERLVHVPCVDLEEGTGLELTHVYAIAWTKEGDAYFTVMYRSEVERIRARSKAGQSGPWMTDYEEMAKKTVVKRLCKVLPLSADVRDFVERDNRIERGEVIDTTLAEEAPAPAKKKGKLDQVLDERREKVDVPANDEPPLSDPPPSIASPTTMMPTGPSDSLRARAHMGEEAALDELAASGWAKGEAFEVNIDKLPAELGAKWRAFMSSPKKGA